MNILSDAAAEIMKMYALKLVNQILSQPTLIFNSANAVDLLCDLHIALSEYSVGPNSDSIRTIRQDPVYRIGLCRQLLFIARDGVVFKDKLFKDIALEKLDLIILS